MGFDGMISHQPLQHHCFFLQTKQGSKIKTASTTQDSLQKCNVSNQARTVSSPKLICTFKNLAYLNIHRMSESRQVTRLGPLRDMWTIFHFSRHLSAQREASKEETGLMIQSLNLGKCVKIKFKTFYHGLRVIKAILFEVVIINVQYKRVNCGWH